MTASRIFGKAIELEPEELRLIQQPKSKLKETLDLFLDRWLDNLDLEFRGSGRLMKTETTKTAERRILLEMVTV